jgi:hypothetical protein
MKLDKETLIKHKFWVVLAAAAPLALITIFVLMVFVSSANANKRKQLEGDEKKFGNPPAVPNKENLDLWQKHREAAEGKRANVWKDAWDVQKYIYLWPKTFEDECQFESGYFATEIKIDGTEADAKHFAGKISAVDTKTQQWIEVKDKDGKTRRFFRTPKLVMVDPAKKYLDFARLVPDVLVSVEYHQSRKFYDPLTETEYRKYVNAYKEKDDAKSPLLEIIRLVNPVIETKIEKANAAPESVRSGVVLLGNAPLKVVEYENGDKQMFLPPANSKFFRYVAQWGMQGDISEDVWLAHEDLWIQKELFYRVKLANESISHFELVAVDGEPTLKKGKDNKSKPLTHAQIAELNQEKQGGTFTFKNPYWQLELKLVKGKVEYKLENLLPRRQRLNVDFMVRLNESDPRMEKLSVSGTTLDPKPLDGAKADVKKQEEKKDEDSYFKTGILGDPVIEKDKPKPPSRTGIYAVEQVLTAETAAVKRIDLVSIGDMTPEECSLSHRTFPDKLRSFLKDDKKELEKKDDVDPNNPPLVPRGLADKAVRKTENGLLKDRYLDVTVEARRIPVAIVLIADQEQIDRVLTSFRNSPMRFLTTQVLLNRYPHSLQAAAGQVQGGGPQPLQFGIRGPGPMRGGEQPKVIDPNAGQAPAGDSESNVEVVIYGQVTLYDRYRSEPAAAAAKQ